MNFVKLCRNHKKVPVFPVLRKKIQILRRCSKILRRGAYARLQLLEALPLERGDALKIFSQRMS